MIIAAYYELKGTIVSPTLPHSSCIYCFESGSSQTKPQISPEFKSKPRFYDALEIEERVAAVSFGLRIPFIPEWYLYLHVFQGWIVKRLFTFMRNNGFSTHTYANYRSYTENCLTSSALFRSTPCAHKYKSNSIASFHSIWQHWILVGSCSSSRRKSFCSVLLNLEPAICQKDFMYLRIHVKHILREEKRR